MFKNEIYIAQLVTAQIKGTISDAQQNELDAWVNASERNALQYQKYTDEKELEEKIKNYYKVNSTAIFQKITNGIKDQQQVVAAPKEVILWPRIGIAAAVVLAILAGAWFLNSNTSSRKVDEIRYASDATPGKIGATLTLANGKKILLSDAANGELVNEAGLTITKTADGQLLYVISSARSDDRFLDNATSRDPSKAGMMNTLSTAKGETYQVKLPDGSLVWLNSASSLTYSANLIKNGQRRIKLTGEAYFEISKDLKHPFVVESAGQEVEVLGTHFNINSYPDEPAIATTLQEGSVIVRRILPNRVAAQANGKPTVAGTIMAGKNDLLLQPGEQSLNTSTGLNAKRVNIDNVIDWKSGDFNLEGVDFNVLMRKIARWYNVEVVYDQSITKEIKMGGWISRGKNLSQVLRFIESSGAVHFEVENNKVIVKI